MHSVTESVVHPVPIVNVHCIGNLPLSKLPYLPNSPREQVYLRQRPCSAKIAGRLIHRSCGILVNCELQLAGSSLIYTGKDTHRTRCSVRRLTFADARRVRPNLPLNPTFALNVSATFDQ